MSRSAAQLGARSAAAAARASCAIRSAHAARISSAHSAARSRRRATAAGSAAASSPAPSAAPPVAFFNADCRDVDLSPYTVLYCAIRGVSSRPKVLDDLLLALSARDAETRLVCAGFGVDLKRKPYADRVAMAGATVLARPGAAEDAPAAERSLPLYGYDAWPRVLVEYVVRGVGR